MFEPKPVGGKPNKPIDPGRRAHWILRLWYWWRLRTFPRRRKDWYRNKHLKSRYWKVARERVLKRDHYMCQVAGCGAKRTLDVHHKANWIIGRELEKPEHLWLLITLCRYHHDMEHIGRRTESGRRNIQGVRFPDQRKAVSQ